MKLQRQRDILKIISALDISPSMYKTAVEKYKHLADFLQQRGIDCDIYPQGSFALGTVVRPNAKDPNAGYDLDFICQVKGNKETLSPENLWEEIESALKSSAVYKERLEIFDKCFTIHYADIGEISFSIDIVPATDEAWATKLALARQSEYPELLLSAIAIPTKPSYDWTTSNPRGYCKWFDEINAPFKEYTRTEFRENFFNEHRHVYGKIEDIPMELERSALQRVIQILKRHRDYYYAKLGDGDELKPTSVILSTLVTQLAKAYSPQISIYELLEFVLNELKVYAKLLKDTADSFEKNFPSKTIIRKKGEEWVIDNPSTPNDNLAFAWNSNARIPAKFFFWVNSVHNDLITALDFEDSQFLSATENAFGKGLVSSVWGSKYSSSTPKPIFSQSAAKPWKK